MKNALLYDWFTVSFSGVDKETIIHVLGMDSYPWQTADNGSRLKYASRLYFDGVSVHWTPDNDFKHNAGVCLEMSGHGCRDFETFGHGDWLQLFDFVKLTGGQVSRIDIAFDDFTGLIDLNCMAAFARKFWFTSRSQKVRIMEESEDGEPDHLGISVCHGSKSSDLYLRCYDKRVEKHAWEIPHWVRFEVQLRHDNCQGFLDAPGFLGERFRGVIANYLNYRCPHPDRLSNKRTWEVCPWWSRFLQGAAALSVNQKKDVEYNKDRLEKHVYGRNHNCLATSILADGLPKFLSEVFSRSEDLPPKYRNVLSSSPEAAEIMPVLDKTSTGQLLSASAQLEKWLDSLAISPDHIEKVGVV